MDQITVWRKETNWLGRWMVRGERHVNIVNETLNGFTMNFNLSPHFTCVFFSTLLQSLRRCNITFTNKTQNQNNLWRFALSENFFRRVPCGVPTLFFQFYFLFHCYQQLKRFFFLKFHCACQIFWRRPPLFCLIAG